MRAFVAVLLVGVAAVALPSPAAAQAPAPKAVAPKAPPCPPPAEQTGENVFACQNCFLCHTIKGEGWGNGKKEGPLDGVGARLKPEEIREAILEPAEWRKKKEQTRMPAMLKKKLSNEQVELLVKYLSSLKTPVKK